MAKIADMMYTSLDTITAFSLQGDFLFSIDELQDTTIANTEEKNPLTGKNGRLLGNLKRNKAVKITGTNGLLSAGMMEAQVGSEFKDEAKAPVAYIDYLTINTNAAVTSFKAVGTAGTEISALYIIDDAGAAVEKLTQTAEEVTTKHFSYSPSNNTLTFFASDYEDGTQIVVYYTRNIAASVLENVSDKYSKTCRLYIDGTAEDKCHNIYHIQYYIPMADFSGNFDTALGSDQTVHAFEADSLATSCGKPGQLWTYTVFGVDAADAE